MFSRLVTCVNSTRGRKFNSQKLASWLFQLRVEYSCADWSVLHLDLDIHLNTPPRNWPLVFLVKTIFLRLLLIGYFNLLSALARLNQSSICVHNRIGLISESSRTDFQQPNLFFFTGFLTTFEQIGSRKSRFTNVILPSSPTVDTQGRQEVRPG